MRIAVLNNWVPFLAGGAEYLADALVRKLEEYGHEATLVRIPFEWNPPGRVIESMLACRAIKLPNVQRVISLKFPAYYVPHGNKVLWLLHQFRQAYDLWGTPLQDLPADAEGVRVRDIVRTADNAFLSEAQRIFVNSRVTADRLKSFNGFDSTVLFPPLLAPEQFSCREFGDFIFFPGRINSAKRQHLVVESMKHSRTGVRLVIAGAPEGAEDLERLRRIIRENKLEGKVEVLGEFISEERKADLMSRALACAYTPYDEDSYGYVTLEACQCRKPTLTLNDSGGILILVENEVTGLVCAPEPRSIAEACDRFYRDRSATRRMGDAAYRRMLALNITWDHVIASLTA